MPAFEHEALFHGGAAEFLAAAVPFVTAAVDAEEPVLVALPGATRLALSAALGRRADAVSFLAMDDLGRNPSRIIPAWRAFVDARPTDGRPIRGIGQPVWAGRSAAELAECHLHESLLDECFHDVTDFCLLCPYDVDALPAGAVEEARRTHAVVRDGDVRETSAGYAATDVRDRHFRGRLPEPTGPTEQLRIRGARVAHDLHRMRERVAAHAAACGLGRARSDDLVLAVDELAVNAVRHGGGEGLLRMWRDGGGAVCEIADRGRLDSPLPGRIRPRHTGGGGRGLWIVNQVCDLVQVRSNDAGTVVRVHVGPERGMIGR